MKPKKIVNTKNTPQKHKQNISFSIQGVFVNHFNISIPKVKYNIQDCQITYNINPLIKYNIADNMALVKIELNGQVQETNEMILNAEIAFTYKINDLKKIMKEVAKDKWDFIDPNNRSILTTLMSISISTLRGIVYERVKGTIMGGKLIPVVNPQMFFQ